VTAKNNIDYFSSHVDVTVQCQISILPQTTSAQKQNRLRINDNPLRALIQRVFWNWTEQILCHSSTKRQLACWSKSN